jgi:hypothetical protein
MIVVWHMLAAKRIVGEHVAHIKKRSTKHAGNVLLSPHKRTSFLSNEALTEIRWTAPILIDAFILIFFFCRA